MELAAYLRTSRENAGLTQTEVAAKLGYANSQFVSNWERGRSAPPLNALRTLAKLYRISMDELFEKILHTSITQAEESMKKQYAAIKKRKA